MHEMHLQLSACTFLHAAVVSCVPLQCVSLQYVSLQCVSLQCARVCARAAVCATAVCVCPSTAVCASAVCVCVCVCVCASTVMCATAAHAACTCTDVHARVHIVHVDMYVMVSTTTATLMRPSFCAPRLEGRHHPTQSTQRAPHTLPNEPHTLYPAKHTLTNPAPPVSPIGAGGRALMPWRTLSHLLACSRVHRLAHPLTGLLQAYLSEFGPEEPVEVISPPPLLPTPEPHPLANPRVG